MGDYMRSTRECAFGQLRPELVQAIRDYLQKHELGTIEADILICCETTSEKTKRGFFRNLVGGDSDPIHYTGMLVTPGWLIWATCGAKFGVVVMAARLQDIQVMDGTTQLINDTGLEVFGFLSGFAERVSAFVGLGPEPAAQKFRAAVKAARPTGKPAGAHQLSQVISVLDSTYQEKKYREHTITHQTTTPSGDYGARRRLCTDRAKCPGRAGLPKDVHSDQG